MPALDLDSVWEAQEKMAKYFQVYGMPFLHYTFIPGIIGTAACQICSATCAGCLIADLG